MSDNTAILAGYTRELIASAGEHELHIFVRPSQFLDEQFRCYDADNCEWISLKGWLFSYNAIAAE